MISGNSNCGDDRGLTSKTKIIIFSPSVVYRIQTMEEQPWTRLKWNKAVNDNYGTNAE